MSATIREVAASARVSVATVSRVLNGIGPVREATRRRVLAAVEELHYRPHSGARSLITNQTGTVGVLLPDIYGEFFSELIRGLDQTARASHYHLLVSSSHSDRAEIEALLREMRGRVDGLVVMSPDIEAKTLRANLDETLPIVLLNCLVDGTGFDSISVDNRGGALAVMEHLAGLGHRRIAIIKGPERNTDARGRLEGYRKGCRLLGLGRAKELELEGDFSEESGYRAGRAILALSPRPTAVFATNDSMAIGCLFAMREAGVEVPGQMALAGFDDIPIARFLSPPLSSVSVSIAGLGEHAMERLLHAITSKNLHVRRHETVPTRLVIRSSTHRPGGAGGPADATKGPKSRPRKRRSPC